MDRLNKMGICSNWKDMWIVDPKNPKHECKLHKALYGLKLAPRLKKFRTTSTKLGLYDSKSGSLFFLVYILIYVDNWLIIENSNARVKEFITDLNKANTSYLRILVSCITFWDHMKRWLWDLSITMQVCHCYLEKIELHLKACSTPAVLRN